MDDNRPAFERSYREAVQGKMAQPSQSQNKEKRLDRT